MVDYLMATQHHFHHSMLFPGTKNLGTTFSKISGSKSTFDSISQEVYAKDLEGKRTVEGLIAPSAAIMDRHMGVSRLHMKFH